MLCDTIFRVTQKTKEIAFTRLRQMLHIIKLPINERVMFWMGLILHQIAFYVIACSSHLNLQTNKLMMLTLNTHKTICLINHVNPITFEVTANDRK